MGIMKIGGLMALPQLFGAHPLNLPHFKVGDFDQRPFTIVDGAWGILYAVYESGSYYSRCRFDSGASAFLMLPVVFDAAPKEPVYAIIDESDWRSPTLNFNWPSNPKGMRLCVNRGSWTVLPRADDTIDFPAVPEPPLLCSVTVPDHLRVLPKESA